MEEDDSTHRSYGTRALAVLAGGPLPPRGARRGLLHPTSGVRAGSAHAQLTPTGNRGQLTAPSPTGTPAPSPTATRPPGPLTQGHVDFVEVLIASDFRRRRRRRGPRGSHQPGAKPVHDWGCGVGAVSREGHSRRPAASHSRSQTSCSAERARALAASSPSLPRQRAERGATETNCGLERPARARRIAALAGRGRRAGTASSGVAKSVYPSPSTFRTFGSGWTRAPLKPSLKH